MIRAYTAPTNEDIFSTSTQYASMYPVYSTAPHASCALLYLHPVDYFYSFRILSTHAYWVLIDDYDPMLRPTRGFQAHALKAGALDYPQPDASNIGGCTGWLKVAALCEVCTMRPVYWLLVHCRAIACFVCFNSFRGRVRRVFFSRVRPDFCSRPEMKIGSLKKRSRPVVSLVHPVPGFRVTSLPFWAVLA